MKPKTKFMMNQWWQRNREKINDIVMEMLIILGFSFICYGAYLIYIPAMWLILGWGLLIIGLPKK